MVIGAMLGLMVVIVAFLSSYASALGKPDAREIPTAVSAAPTVRGEIDASPLLKVHSVPDLTEARRMVEHRAAYGALVFHAGGPITLLVATGGGHAVADVLTQVAQQQARVHGTTLRTVDVAPTSPNDPNGSVEFYCVVFLFLGGALGASVLGRVLGPVRRPSDAVKTLGVALLYTALLSVAVTFFADIVFGALVGHFGPLFLALWLYLAAVALTVRGVAARVSLLPSVVLILLLIALGNPSSGGPVPRPLLNGFYSALNPLLPQGAALSALRGIQYFDYRAIGLALMCLAIWAAAGLVLLGAAALGRPGKRATAGTDSTRGQRSTEAGQAKAGGPGNTGL
jgi:hypothetical protein